MSQEAGWRRDLLRFGIVGGAGFVTDFVVFNLVLATLPEKPITSRIVAVVVATMVTYLGNRNWTWRDRSRTAMHREVVTFFVLNAIGLAIGVVCLFVSHYVLGLDSPVADNISSYAIGLPLGTLFRFWSYQRFVFKHAN